MLRHRSVLALAGMLALFTAATTFAGPRFGNDARKIYDSLPGPEQGPFCTGACPPGVPCVPSCSWRKEGNGWSCVKTVQGNRTTWHCNAQNRNESFEAE